MPNKLKDIKDNIITYSCKYCNYVFNSEIDAKQCETDCKFMIECYQYGYKVSFDEAKAMFLMEKI